MLPHQQRPRSRAHRGPGSAKAPRGRLTARPPEPPAPPQAVPPAPQRSSFPGREKGTHCAPLVRKNLQDNPDHPPAPQSPRSSGWNRAEPHNLRPARRAARLAGGPDDRAPTAATTSLPRTPGSVVRKAGSHAGCSERGGAWGLQFPGFPARGRWVHPLAAAAWVRVAARSAGRGAIRGRAARGGGARCSLAHSRSAAFRRGKASAPPWPRRSRTLGG